MPERDTVHVAAHAGAELAEWQHDYNMIRPHSKLGSAHPPRSQNKQANNVKALLLSANNQGSTLLLIFQDILDMQLPSKKIQTRHIL